MFDRQKEERVLYVFPSRNRTSWLLRSLVGQLPSRVHPRRPLATPGKQIFGIRVVKHPLDGFSPFAINLDTQSIGRLDHRVILRRNVPGMQRAGDDSASETPEWLT